MIIMMAIVLAIGIYGGMQITPPAIIETTQTSCNIDYSQMRAIIDDFEPVVVETVELIESSVYDAFPLRTYRECGRHAITYHVNGQSMHPLISDGTLMAEPVKWENVEVGDVVEIIVKGEHIFHALVYKGDDYAISRGYNNPHNDAWTVLPDMVTLRYCIG